MSELHLQSTRGSTSTKGLLEAVEMGLADDGGLFMPTTFPQVNWASLPQTNFQECSHSFLSQWLGTTLSSGQISQWIGEALNFQVPIVPIVPLTNSSAYENTHVLELFHGPTLSFKDFGARSLAFLLSQRIQQSQQSVTILVATSGDTGSAVADGLSGREGLRVVLLYPKDQVSPIQEKQLIVRRDGVLAVRVEGTFDDCQRLVKGSFSDERLKNLRLSTANSINIGRLIPQMLYYVWATRQLNTEQATFVVPSGNLGNLTAGIFARKSGIPACQHVAAHNVNDFFPRYLADSSTEYSPSLRTISNAMDVGAPSNFERLKFLLSPAEMSALINGYTVSDAETLLSMSTVFNETGYVSDPHTAVGLSVVKREALNKNAGPVVVLSTAHPAKFPKTVEKAIGKKIDVPDQLRCLLGMPTDVLDLKPIQQDLSDVILSHKW